MSSTCEYKQSQCAWIWEIQTHRSSRAAFRNPRPTTATSRRSGRTCFPSTRRGRPRGAGESKPAARPRAARVAERQKAVALVSLVAVAAGMTRLAKRKRIPFPREKKEKQSAFRENRRHDASRFVLVGNMPGASASCSDVRGETRAYRRCSLDARFVCFGARSMLRAVAEHGHVWVGRNTGSTGSRTWRSALEAVVTALVPLRA